MREFRYLLPAGLVVLFLFLLSGLVAGPAPETDVSLPPPVMEAALLPAVLPATEDSGDRSPIRTIPRQEIAQFSPCYAGVPSVPAALSDANGRPVCALSYLESVYLLFRQEAAAG